MNFLINTCLRPEFRAKLCQKRSTFPFAGRYVQVQKIQVCPYDPTKLASRRWSFIKMWSEFQQKTVAFDDIVNFIVEKNIVTYVDFDCGFTFYPETTTKIRHINRERNCFSGACEKPKWIASNDQHDCCIIEQHSSNFFLNPTFHVTWFQQL